MAICCICAMSSSRRAQAGGWKCVGAVDTSGEPIMTHGLTELIETRIGTLPAAVGTVIDALAIGEPIALATLRRIADSEAVEDADTLAA